MGRGKSLKRKLAEGRGTPHENTYKKFSKAEKYSKERIDKSCNESDDNDVESPVDEFGIWWRYENSGHSILFKNQEKAEERDGLSYHEVLEIAPQVEEASLVSYNSNKSQHILIEITGQKFYVEINSMGDISLPCSIEPKIKYNRERYFIRTDYYPEIANFSSIQDWNPEDFKRSRERLRIN